MFTYIFNNQSYTNTDVVFMTQLGMSEEQIASVLAQKQFITETMLLPEVSNV